MKGAIDLHAPEPIAGSYFVATYPPFSAWDERGAQIFVETLGRRREPGAVPPALGAYIHIPFCVKRCEFCYYLSYDDRPEQLDAYIEALLAEARILAAEPGVADRGLTFAYIGGGTPSALSERRIDHLLRGLREALPWERAREVTFECAPRTVTPDKLRVLREHGVTRVSMGVQAMDDEVLRRNGRIHRVADIERAWEAVAAAGFPVVNLDLIVGLVGQSAESFFESLDRVIEMDPESITVYQLEIPLNTPLYKAMQEGTLDGSPAEWSTKRSRLATAFKRLESAGYHVRSAYTAVKDPRRHGFVYQDAQYTGADLLGLGASAFSCFGGVQHQNRAALPRYLAALEAGGLPLWRGHEMSAEERAIREMVLQWKLGRVDRRGFRRRHGVDPAEHFSEALRPLCAAGLARIEPDAIVLTLEGLVQADRVLPSFYLPHHRGIRYS